MPNMLVSGSKIRAPVPQPALPEDITALAPRLTRRIVLAALTSLAAMTAAQADTPLLTLTGTVDGKPGTSVTFDAAALAALPQITFTTSTVWTEGPQEFTGVSLGAVLRAAGMTGALLEAYAANDYSVEIPVEDWPENAPIIAHSRNGTVMSLRDKGPLWIVYPYDSDPAYRSEVIYTRSIWQLERIEVRP